MEKSFPVRAGLVAAILGIALGCASKAVWSTSDQDFDISQYKTYQWVTPAVARELELQNPKVDYLIMNWVRIERRPDIEAKVEPVVETDLQNRGFQQATNGHPDFYITYYAKAKDEDWISSWQGITPGQNAPVVIFPNFHRGQSQENLDHVVYLVVYDAKSRKPVWTGRANTKLFGESFGEKEMVAASDRLVSEFKSS